jgi:catechol 2,3-dioxygenase-like lactoylglutathione lyase family enzyme
MTTGDERPPIWVGHVVMRTSRIGQSERFFRGLGMRFIERDGNAVILELRGGTHLVLLEEDDVAAGDASFDLMVEDIDAAHRKCEELGGAPSAIQKGKIHRTFRATDPTGGTITFYDSHVSKFAV